MNFIKITIKYLLVIMMTFSPSLALAEMRSNSYILHENINHSFDGPIISSISHTVSGSEVTVSFMTNVLANAFVIYNTDASMVNSAEQGMSAKNTISHSIVLSGLEANTTYYYQVRAEGVNGGETTDTTVRSFVTGSNESDTEIIPPESNNSGGGVMIIDKTDKVAPIISNVEVNVIDDSSVSMSWDTNEEANSFGEYGETIQYGDVDGRWDKVVKHYVVLKNLKSDSSYHIRAVSSDAWGNIGYSEDQTIKTKISKEEENTTIDNENTKDQKNKEEKSVAINNEKSVIAKDQENIDQNILIEVSNRMLEFARRLFPQATLNNRVDLGEIKTIQDLSRFMPVPILSGEPRVEVGSDRATIYWSTDIDSSSQVAVSTDSYYQSRKRNPYMQVVGDAQNLSKDHRVYLFGLSADTIYHYQLRSKSNFGPLAVSRDFTFKTSDNNLKIISFLTQVKDGQTANVKWVTNKEANSSVRYIPYHNNIAAIDEAKIVNDNAFNLIHDIAITDFQPGVFYDIEIISADRSGVVTRQEINHFSTQENDLPPEISHIKTDSTVFIDKNNKTQTVVSWLTNEPTNAQILYQEGVRGAGSTLSEHTEINENFTKEHTFVLTKFKPGVVYSFQVKVVDSGGNEVLSKINTFMTAKNKESIIQIIIKILEDTFGWVKKLM